MYTAENGGYCEGGNQSELKSLVEDGVDYATELGMYVIIDWHILHDLTPEKYQDEAIAFFDDMSAKYADYDNVLYEICNEPNGSTTWSDVKSYAEAVIPVIRANDEDAIIIVGTPTWSQDVDLAADDPITGEDNIAYTTHFYAATHKENIRDKVKTARDKGLCVFISEFSICDASGNGGIDYDSAEDWFDYINDNDMSYAGWSLCNKNETSALISSSCDKTSGWTDDDLSDAGIWLKSQIQD
jgi:endoglucanase